MQVNAIAKRPCGEANHKHAHVPAAKSSSPAEALRGGSSNKSSSKEEGGDDLASVSVDDPWQPKAPNTSGKFFSEQAKLLSDLFTHPWKVADCVVKDDASSSSGRHQMGPKYSDWR